MSEGKKPLIIVESPAKAKTIEKYLGGKAKVIASKGHIKDLPERELGVDIKNGFKPKFLIVKGKGKIVQALKDAASKASICYLGSDPDREGEAIAWHIAEEIRKVNPNISRVLFYEVTKKGIEEGLKSSRDLDRNLYESQVGRRILDRLVGYMVSPLLWRKVASGLSAGRVQSPALRLIVEREREIEAFKPEEYWVISAFLRKGDKKPFVARLRKIGGVEARIGSEEEATRVCERLKDARFIVANIKKKEVQKAPPPPFITSSLQQEAWRHLHLSPKQTMMIAQELYEGIEIPSEGLVGLITYMRTDSFRLSSDAVEEARELIKKRFGSDFLPPKPPVYRAKGRSQDAHEAIRPTSVLRTPETLKGVLKHEHFRLYELIYNRFLASQMCKALSDETECDIEAKDALFCAKASVLKFPGFLQVWREERDEKDEGDEDKTTVPEDLALGDELCLEELTKEQRFTKPKPRYSDATLIRELEERGIGRPSTYAIIVSHLLEKGYVERVEGKLRPTELGRIVCDLLTMHFGEIVDYGFTAKMEENLDKIASGEKKHTEVLSEFYKDFSLALEKAKKEMDLKNLGQSEAKCPECGSPLVVRVSKSGVFLGCSRFPECRFVTEFSRDEHGNVKVQSDQDLGLCPDCNAKLVLRNGRFGRFIACSRYPECKFTKPVLLSERCPACNAPLVEKKSSKGKVFYSCSGYPKCKFSTRFKPISRNCPQCGAPSLFEGSGKRKSVFCLKEGCEYAEGRRPARRRKAQ
jgi:DNA topoisomerase-1